jgi:glycosyltransferase involved in cell wall biosynthesis
VTSPGEGVVFVLPSLVGGGAERVTRAVADALAATEDGPVTVVSLLDPDPDPPTDRGAVVVGLGARRIRGAYLPLLRLVRADRPAVVVTTLKHVSIALGTFHRALPRPTRQVARIANTYSAEGPALVRRWPRVDHWLVRRSHRRIDHFVCVSEGVRDDLVAGFGVHRDRCTVIPNPVDVDHLEELAGAPLAVSVPPAAVTFLSVGRLEPQKDHTTLLRAFAEVAHEIDAALVVVGDGSLRSELEDLAAHLGVADRVLFTGARANPYPLFRAADVLVLSSRYEGMPNVLLEALALGLRCVATDCPHGPAEILVEPGLGALVPVGDAPALAGAMVAAARPAPDPGRGVAHVRAHHSPEGAVAAYRRVLREVSGGGRGR